MDLMNWPSVCNFIGSKFNKTRLWLASYLLLVSIFFASPVKADENFLIDLHSEYKVTQSGVTNVTHNFTIVNKTPSFFINRYSILVSSIKPTSISAKMGDQVIQPVVSVKDFQTTITVDFPEKVVGEDKSLNFSIQYNTEDLARVKGKVLEVSIPPMTKTETFRNFSVNVSTPTSFGLPTRSQPPIVNSTNRDSFQTVTYDKSASKGIISVYGAEQFYQLNLNYKLSNPGNQPVLSQVTFPPDTSFQKIYYEEIAPIPDSWKIDADGNWLGTYKLAANSQTTVTVIAKAKLSLIADLEIPIQPVLPEFTKEQEFWPISSLQVQDLAKKTTTAEEIYNFTLEKLTYTTEPLTNKLTRLGTLKVLKEPTLAACQEYADVFITLARANNIPARRLIGYAQTENQQLRPIGFQGVILHAWAEYYDVEKNNWKVIDPTWGDTTGGIDYFNQTDLNHVVFSINGVSSVLPYPAGSYAAGEEPTKSVNVSFADNFPKPQADPAIELIPKKLGNFVLPGWYELVLINPTGQAWYNLNFSFPEELSLKLDLPLPDRLLPYQTYKTTFSAYNQALPNNLNHFDFKFGLKHHQRIIGGGLQNIYVIPKFITQLGYTKFIMAVAICLGIAAIITWSLLVLGFKWANSLRRQSQKSPASTPELHSLPATQPQDQEDGSDSQGSSV